MARTPFALGREIGTTAVLWLSNMESLISICL
jgi:hypothetical protein